ncbi:hypothetical protein [Larkinella ripae]
MKKVCENAIKRAALQWLGKLFTKTKCNPDRTPDCQAAAWIVIRSSENEKTGFLIRAAALNFPSGMLPVLVKQAVFDLPGDFSV